MPLRQLCFALAFTLGAVYAFEEPSYFPNHVLRDQNGRAQPFYSGLLQNKTVVIHSFFEACHGSCPVMFGKLKAIQDSLADHLGKDLLFLSISVDPANDTPDKLRQLADSLNAKPGWLFLSGAKQNIDWVLFKLGQYEPIREKHSTIFLVGNEASGQWTKVDAALSPEVLRASIVKALNSGN